MTDSTTVSFDRDRALVQAMRLLGEPVEVIDDFLMCLDLDERQHEELRRVARTEPEAGIANGDVIEMNPLTAQPQRSKPRS
jgi:hypothetical protein